MSVQVGGGGVLVSVKGKFFDTRFGLIHVQTGKKNFVKGPPPHQIPRNCFGHAAGGMPLAFTQEDFLVPFLSLILRQTSYQIHASTRFTGFCHIEPIQSI